MRDVFAYEPGCFFRTFLFIDGTEAGIYTTQEQISHKGTQLKNHKEHKEFKLRYFLFNLSVSLSDHRGKNVI